MDPFERAEEQIHRREQSIEARKIAARLKAIERELEAVPNAIAHPHTETVSTRSKTHHPFRKISNMGKFALTVLGVTMAVCLSPWVGLTVLIMGTIFAAWAGKALVIMGVIWIAYKLFLEDKD
jgi:Flp pilus assembly protein TadB